MDARSSRKKARRGRWLRVFADVLVVVGSYALVFVAYHWAIRLDLLDRGLPHVLPYAVLAGVHACMVVLVFRVLGLYRDRVSVLNLWELQTAVKGIAFTASLFFSGLFFYKSPIYSRLVVVGATGLSAVLLLVVRRWLASRRHRRSPSSPFAKRVLIVGTGESADLLLKKIAQSPQVGWQVVGVLSDGAAGGRVGSPCATPDPSEVDALVHGGSGDLDRLLAELRPDRVLLVERGEADGGLSLDALVEICRSRGVSFGVVPRVGGLRVDELRVEEVGAVPVLWPVTPRDRVAYEVSKRAVDIVLASAALLVSLPAMALIAVAVRLDSPGPVLFRHERVGRNGRRFVMVKFRTMTPDAPAYAESPPQSGDERVTRVGRTLRANGLDELPNLWNVVRGEMSLVGPRPEMAFITDGYSELERRRLSVPAGVVGIWQLSPDREGHIHDNLEYDLYYLHNRSHLLDAVILFEAAVFLLNAVASTLGLRRAGPPRRVIPEEASGSVIA